MPTSRKRSKKRRKIRFLGVILGICLLAAILLLAAVLLRGCSKDRKEASDEPAPEKSASPEIALSTPTQDFSALFGHKAVTSGECRLYTMNEGSPEDAGSAGQGVIFDIGETQSGDMIEIRDSGFWIRGDDVTPSDRWYRNATNLLPFGEEIVTANPYHILDEEGNTVAEISRSDTYQVYVQPGEEGMYGIRFQNAIFLIPSSEVTEVRKTEGGSNEDAGEIPVLMYHFFYSDADGGRRVDGNYVEVNELDEQLKYISENGFTALSMREVLYWMQRRAKVPSHSIAITIDDADPSVHQYAMPVFAKYALRATNFVICGWQPEEMPYELWEMRENGMELQSHGFLTHTGGCSGMGHGGLLLCMDHDAGVADTKQAFDYVDGGFVYCYPFGDINEHAESIIRDGGAKLAFTTDGGRITQNMDPLALPRVRVTGGNGLSAFAASIG